ncbi:hypothetical protein Q75_02935 [Bacillus coahuilensis p1.1.43]|uniref:Uncharacterized protein n=1 Tax=Bacillus coahuilensis p1.1.43 TaxID=1150625 RepID=A0A147KBC9_9BACI|nr:hypothetical protein [Bacillus coahuilensis]KUP08305.1 hypothetical protein Q75_02935 [Bacillus coahuilensis p1.1.43]
MKEVMKKLFIVFIISSLIIPISPLQVLAAKKGTEIPIEPPLDYHQEKEAEVPIIGEIESMREENAKFFLKEDMSYEMAVYLFLFITIKMDYGKILIMIL